MGLGLGIEESGLSTMGRLPPRGRDGIETPHLNQGLAAPMRDRPTPYGGTNLPMSKSEWTILGVIIGSEYWGTEVVIGD